ncbi:MAG: hypothetical protein C5B51_18955 [Terriglobia bacterium]|nr:MAG: hypothetical protein C5B51_18955 [Terriglobia bacterium]
MLPLVRVDRLWRTGLAGSIPSALSFLCAGVFLFAAARRVFDAAAASAATGLFAVNPNLLYLQSTAMGEAVFYACMMALLYCTIRFRETQGWALAAGAGAACALGSLTRYEAWFLIPFAAAYFVITAHRRRAAVAALFAVVAVLGPAYWMVHNWWLTGDALDFYRGPYSAKAIQGSAPYPGHGDWRLAWLYFRTAVQLSAGPGLLWAGLAGIAATLLKRVFWPVLLLSLPGAFYIWSMHSAATPIFVPGLWPNSYYNTRYGLAALPLLALAAGGLVALVPQRARILTAVLVLVAGNIHWALHRNAENWITWKESQVNSEGRRQWIREAAEFLGPRYQPGSGILTSFGDVTAIYREAGIPLRETFTGDNGVIWQATVTRPDLFLRQQWAVVMGGDAAQSAINRAGRFGIRYRLEKTIVAPKSPVIEIYRRI